MKPEASKRYIKHFSICNIKGSEKFSWYLPVHLISGVPDLGDFKEVCSNTSLFDGMCFKTT